MTIWEWEEYFLHVTERALETCAFEHYDYAEAHIEIAYADFATRLNRGVERGDRDAMSHMITQRAVIADHGYYHPYFRGLTRLHCDEGYVDRQNRLITYVTMAERKLRYRVKRASK